MLSSSDYSQLIDVLKARIQAARVRAALAVNQELVLLYWSIGRDILERQDEAGWGGKVVDQISADLQRAFPGMKGFSVRNLKYMRAFAEAWPDEEFVQQVAAQIPWFHNCLLLDRVKEVKERRFYIAKTIEHGWSRAILQLQIEGDLYRRSGQALTNFERTLPPPQSDLARQVLKDPYVFDFLSLREEAEERELEQGLVSHIRDFLLELGVGFAFVGSQVPLEVDGRTFYLDLLFYHLRLRCFVVVELKTIDFEPEHAGKLAFYLSAADDLLRHPGDGPTIGLVLCRSRSKVIVEYALRDSHKPIGVSTWQLTRALPDELASNLPPVERLEAELSDPAEESQAEPVG